jgi:hypothetical protein
MKRFLTAALIAGVFSTTGLVGCSEKAETTEKEKVVTPGGTTETTKDVTIKQTGDNPPPNSAGQTVEPPK